MKSKQLLILGTLVLFGLLLSACAGGAIASSWPGVQVGSEAIYLSNNQNVFAVDPLTGKELWRFPVEPIRGASFYAPVAEGEDGALAVGGYNKILYSNQNNQPSWTFDQAKNSYIASAAIDENGMIYAPNGDGKLYALSPGGQLEWTFEADHALWAAPLIIDDTIYLAAMDHRVYALDKQTGEVIWETEDLGGALVDTPTIDSDEMLYVGTFGNEVIAINRQTGEVENRFEASNWVWSSPLFYEGRLFFGDLNGNFYAIDAGTFEKVWQIQPETVAKRQITGRPLAFDGKIFFGSETGNFFSVDPQDGTILNTRTLCDKCKLLAGPVASGDLILVAPIGQDSPLIALDANGTQKWSFVPVK